jgi:hypothetical protein
MKIPASFKPSLGEWADAIGSDYWRVDAVISTLTSDLLCEGQLDFKSTISRATSTKWKDRLWDLRNEISWSIVKTPTRDIVLDEDSPELEQEETIRKIRKSVAESREIVKPGESRESAFIRTLEPLSKRARRIEIFDQYAGKNINLRNESAIWLISKILMTNSEVVLVIYTQDIVDNDRDGLRQGVGFQNRRERIRNSLESIVSNMHGHKGEVRVVFPSKKLEMHDRIFSFRFDQGETQVNVGKGIDIFESEISKEPRSLSLGTLSHVKSLRELFSVNRLSEQDISVKHSSTCSSCEN